VDALVETHQNVLVGGSVECLEVMEEGFGAGAGLGVEPERGELGRVSLELRAHLGDVLDVGRLDRGDERPTAWLHGHEVLEREPLHGLAQRGAADAELAHQLVLAQDGARREAQRHDPVAKLHVGVLGDQPRGRGVRDRGRGIDGHRVRARSLRHSVA
jgi:hypothetical protein